MTAESIQREENRVQRQHNRSHADAEMFRAGQVGEPHSFPRIMRKQDDEQRRQIKKVAVDVLNDERERAFAEKSFARFANGAVDRVGPERLVIGATIIIAGETKSGRNPQNQKRRREWRPGRPPRRQDRAKNRVRRGAPEFRRVKRREIVCAIAAEPVAAIAGLDVLDSLKRRPRRINDERGETKEHHERLEPPHIGTGRFAKASLLRQSISVRHIAVNSSYYPAQRQRAGKGISATST